MKASETVIVWTPKFAPEVLAKYPDLKSPHPGEFRAERLGSNWQRTPGDLWMPAISLGEMGDIKTTGDRVKELLAVFILLNTATVRDGIDPAKAHAAFLNMDEHREAISPDAPGADYNYYFDRRDIFKRGTPWKISTTAK